MTCEIKLFSELKGYLKSVKSLSGQIKDSTFRFSAGKGCKTFAFWGCSFVLKVNRKVDLTVVQFYPFQKGNSKKHCKFTIHSVVFIEKKVFK